MVLFPLWKRHVLSCRIQWVRSSPLSLLGSRGVSEELTHPSHAPSLTVSSPWGGITGFSSSRYTLFLKCSGNWNSSTIGVTRAQKIRIFEAFQGPMPDASGVTGFILFQIWESAFLSYPHTTPSLCTPDQQSLFLGSQTCVISTEYLVAHNCLQWGDRNVRHVSSRSRTLSF